MTRRMPRLLFEIAVALLIIAAVGGAKSFALGETSREDYPLANGITESTVYVTVDGKYNVRTHILRIAPDSGATFKASCGGYYVAGSTGSDRKKIAEEWSSEDWIFESVRNQAGDYEMASDTEGDVIAASNGDFYDVSKRNPKGCLVIEGNKVRRNKTTPFFAVLKKGGVVIRRAGGNLNDVQEAIGGRDIVVWNGKVKAVSDGLRNPREAIGICKDGTVVIVNVDGREPASAGVTLKELGRIMKAQGCQKALNLDGGGSASFMTKRIGDDKLQFRSNHSDGPERGVSSALLILRGNSSYTEEEYVNNTVVMKSSATFLRKEKSGLFRYRINGKNQTGFFAVNGESYLFSDGKGVTAKVKIGNSTYSFSKGRLVKCSDRSAGSVIIGYCGGKGKSGKNLVYAYHSGDKYLKIGLNPRLKKKNGLMKNWSSASVGDIPWYAFRAEIKYVYLGPGVTNLGDYFLFSTKDTMTGGAKAPSCCLKTIHLPASLTKIGDYSLYNKPKLADVKMPSGIKRIGKGAFKYSGKGSLTFKGKELPVFGKASLRKAGFKTIMVKRSNSWKKFLARKGFRKIGYRKTVRLY